MISGITKILIERKNNTSITITVHLLIDSAIAAARNEIICLYTNITILFHIQFQFFETISDISKFDGKSILMVTIYFANLFIL